MISERSRKLHRTRSYKLKNIDLFKEDKTMLFSSLYIAAMAVIGTKITEEVNERM